MLDLPEGFYSGDLYCFPLGPASAGHFAYIPGAPRVETDQGKAKASLVSSPAAGVLSLETVWQPDPAALAAAEAEIRSRYPEADAIRLEAAAFQDAAATLRVTPANGAAITVGPNPASGLASNRVVFQAALTAGEKLAAISAFHSQPGALELRYEATLQLRESATAELIGDLAGELKALAPKPPEPKSTGFFGKKKDPAPPPPPPDLAACAAGVERALTSGKLKLARADSPNASAAAKQKTETNLRRAAAKALFDKLTQMGADAAYVSSFAIRLKATEPETVAYRVSRAADPAEGLARNGGGKLISQAGAPLPEPSR